ncbi:glycosyltransferase family 4 protein [Croceitalea sp. MTPC5]|uniref:glycosyltransferase n=1 Tax=Croceitalea sp. MTPC5 TaxID=3056565 RepID=UPI002B38809D|nr:glycosyltransferase family 4 protein [Croceitalea sp. MTPC5]
MIRKKNKILLVLPSLRAGGAERVISFVAQKLDRDMFEITLLVIGHNKDSSFTPESTNVVFLEKNRVLFSFIPIFSYLKKHNPDIVLSTIGHVNTLMALQSLLFKKIIFIGREVNVISVFSTIQPSKKWYSIINTTKYSYRLLDIILCQSKDMAQDLQLNFNIPIKKIRIINNPISSSFSSKSRYPNNEIPKFITVGSLVERKGHKRILDALSKYDGPYQYTIIGDGDLSSEILHYADEKGMRSNINHIPFTKNVSNYLKTANVFLQGSFVEGFPNALLESCACGTPAVAFNAPGGINEIIENGVNGFIVENEIEFVDKLNLLLKKKLNPEVVSSTVFKKFNSQQIMKNYQNLFLEVLQKKL